MSETKSFAAHVRGLADRLMMETGVEWWYEISSNEFGHTANFECDTDKIRMDTREFTESLAITAASQAVVEWLGRNGFDKEGA
jgi:hypothetical protein